MIEILLPLRLTTDAGKGEARDSEGAGAVTFEEALAETVELEAGVLEELFAEFVELAVALAVVFEVVFT